MKPLHFLPLTLFLAAGTALAQNPAANPPTGQQMLDALGAAPATTNLAPNTDTTQLRIEFDRADNLRAAAADGTQERAEAAQQAATLAAKIGWLTFDAGKYEEAASWFDRQAGLRRESYTAWRTALLAQGAETAATIQGRIDGAKTDAERAQWRGISASMQGLTITQLQIWARQNNDSTTLLDVARQKLKLAQGLLADAKQANNQAAINEKTLQVIGALDDIGSAQTDLALFTEAANSYAQSKALRQALPPDVPGRNLFESFRQMAVLRGRSGDLTAARDLYLQALSMRETEAESRRKAIASAGAAAYSMALTSDIMGEVMMLNNLGKIANDSGDYKASQAYYDRALASLESVPKEGLTYQFALRMRNSILSNIAILHSEQGLVAQARQELEAVIQQQREMGDNESAALGLANLGGFLYEAGNLTLAERHLEQARQIAAASQDLPKLVTFTLHLASLLSQSGRLDEAEKRGAEGLALARKSGDSSLAGDAARTLAEIRLTQGKPAEAKQLLGEAALSDQRVGAPLSRAWTLELQGRTAEAGQDLPGAVDAYKQAVGLIEGVRATASSESAFSSLKNNYRVYERLVQALLKMGRAEEAFDYLNRSRSKQMQDALRIDSLKTGNKTLQALLERAGTLDTRTRAMEAQLQTEQARPDVERDQAKIRNLQGAIATTRGEWRKAVEQIKAADPSYEKLFTVKPLVLSETQRSIPANAAFVMYVPLKAADSGAEELHIFLVTKESLKIIIPGVRADDLWQRIRAVRRQIAGRQDEALSRAIKGNTIATVVGRGDTSPAPATAVVPGEPSLSENLVALHNMLIRPIEADVATKKLLAFIPTQLLYYLPMQALAKRQGEGLRFLIEDKELVYLTGADVMKVVQAPDTGKAPRGLVAFGDPVGADLPNAEEEVKAIARIFPAGSAYEGAQVTKAAVTNGNNLDRRVVHFATHGRLDPAVPSKSYILLSPGKTPGDEQLTVGEVWDLPLQKVDLVALSACDTAIGERDPNGTEITTLAEAFSSAGASSVLASLWSVADDSTRVLMVEFYRQLAAGKSKSAALQAAQIAVMKQPGYHHPYFWAPFVLMGDWR